MKQIFTLVYFFLCFSLHSQAVYVKQTATGANNGTSWTDAFTTLDAALSSPSSIGKAIWVAAGTYKPSTPAPNHSFLVRSGTSIYGGFKGSETTLNERDASANPTILSGDILGDDIAADFTQKRTDNSQHVVVVFVETTNAGSTIDGFTIKGGQTLVASPNADLTRRGGGILINAKATVRNCHFTDNYGESGAAIAALDALSDLLLVDNCLFEANKATEDAVLFLRSTPNSEVNKCNFINNNTKRGALYPSRTITMTIDSCLFEGNTSLTTNATKFYGAGMFTWQANFEISNCIFRANKADNAAGMYCDGRELNSSFSVENCLFESNETIDYGGTSIFNNQANFTMDNCVFKNNKAPSSGAALYNSANTTFNITDCTFDGNTAAFAGAIANYGLNCTGIYENCIFENNKATSGGGALSNGFKADVTYRECSFMSNFANYGGAIFTQNDTTSITLDECWFQDNEAAGSSGNAGAVYINTNIYAEFLGTTFYQNRAVTGGAFSANGDKHFNIDKCAFIENVASTQGAAINFNHIDATITNTLFAKNINTGTGAGGAISSNASSSEISKIKAVNCTFVENVAAIGAGVAQWESTTDPVGVAEITLLNCLFQNPDGESYTIEDGTPDVYSLGGNQCSDQTLELYLTNAKDVHNILNEFIDPNLNNYAPTMTSAAVNAGIKDGAPLDDYLGVLRSSIPDVGYIETGTVGTNSPSNYVLMMQCIPNPAVDQTTISFNHERSGKAQISVWNQLGQQIAQYNTEKTSNEFSFPLNISQYATGVYKVQVHIGAVKHEGTFVKQ